MFFRNLFYYFLTALTVYQSFVLFPRIYLIFQKTCVLFAGMWLSYIIYRFLKKNFINKRLPAENKAVFITGCDSGFGHELAKRLDSLGYRVFAGCYDSKGDGALHLTNICSSNLMIVPIDVTSDESVADAKQIVKKHLNGNVLWGVVNNAGVPQAGEIDWTSIHEIKRVCEVNTFGTVRVTKAFLPFLKVSKGRVVNITSSVGRFAIPGAVAYCMSKGAAVIFTEGIRIELEKWGIKVMSIEPFFYKTGLTSRTNALDLVEKMWSTADSETRETYGEKYLENFKKSCDFLDQVSSTKIHQVVECFEDALISEDPQYTYFPSYLPHKIVLLIVKLLPDFVHDNLQRLYLERNIFPEVKLKRA